MNGLSAGLPERVSTDTQSLRWTTALRSALRVCSRDPGSGMKSMVAWLDHDGLSSEEPSTVLEYKSSSTLISVGVR
jgi:hypothetical protein